jgi:hypothetical protein
VALIQEIKGGIKVEHPILFSTAMVQAILEGRKTQTRRVMKPQPEWRKAPENVMMSDGYAWEKGGTRLEAWPDEEKFAREIAKYCPYGKPGDTLWVRETWGKDKYGQYHYRAEYPEHDSEPYPIWHPSIHMPKEAARLLLTVKDVRVERLHDISEEDASAEGMDYLYETGQFKKEPYTSTEAFEWLWNEINKSRGFSWETNPWVWVVEFERK